MKLSFRILLMICLVSSITGHGQNTNCNFDTSRFAVLPFSEMHSNIVDSIILIKEAGLTEEEKCILQGMMVDMLNSLKQNDLPFQYADYKIQLIAGFDSNGEKNVWVNGFCKHSKSYNNIGWKTQLKGKALMAVYVILSDGLT